MATQRELRVQRLQQLKQELDRYVDAEKTRIENEVSVMEAILQGRTGGAGIQTSPRQVIEAVAQNDLAAYLNPQT